jgi:signal transduction histidine kinase
VPLRIRLALLFAVGTAVVLTLAGVLFYLQLRSSLEASLDASLQARADALVTRLAGTDSPASRVLAGDSAIAQLLDGRGQVRAASPAAGGNALLGGAGLAATRGGAVLETRIVNQGRLRLWVVPVNSDGPAVLAVGASTDIIDGAEDRIRNVMLLATAPMVLLSGLAAWGLSGAALRPVERMRRQAAAMGVADTGSALEVPSTRDEIAKLAHTMNDLLGRLHDARAHDRAFVADAGHELRTPLTILSAELELALRAGRTRDELVEAVANASAETHRLIRLAEALLALARLDAHPRPVHSEPVDVMVLLERAVRAAAPHASAVAVRIELDVEPSLTVFGDADQLRQAVDNLLTNAVRHAPADSVVVVAARRQAGTDRSGVVVEVRDQGPGFAPAFLPRAFDRFSRADDARSRRDGGAGLGLAIVAAIAHGHGGQARAVNQPGGGASVWITLDVPAVEDVR